VCERRPRREQRLPKGYRLQEEEILLKAEKLLKL